MTKKEYLEQVSQLEQQIETKLMTLSALKAMIDTTSYHLKRDVVKETKKNNKREEIMVRIVDIENEIDKDVDRLVDLKMEITEAICKVKEPNYQDLLRKKYLENKDWQTIMREMHYEKSWMHEMHNNALKAIRIPGMKRYEDMNREKNAE